MREQRHMFFAEHDYGKVNHVTIIRDNRAYDLYKCRDCGAEGKRMGLNDFITATKYKKPCKEPQQVKTIRITYCLAMGHVFSNLTPNSVHDVIAPPPCYVADSKGVWVMGVREPVKVLNNEFIVIK